MSPIAKSLAFYSVMLAIGTLGGCAIFLWFEVVLATTKGWPEFARIAASMAPFYALILLAVVIAHWVIGKGRTPR